MFRSLSDVEDYAGMCTCMVKLPNMSSVLVGSDMGQVAQCSLLVFDPRRSFYQHSQSKILFASLFLIWIIRTFCWHIIFILFYYLLILTLYMFQNELIISLPLRFWKAFNYLHWNLPDKYSAVYGIAISFNI